MTNNLTPRPEVRGAIVGVDTHKHIHVAVAIDTCGIHLGDQSFAGIVKLTKSSSSDPQDAGLQSVANPPYWAPKAAVSLNLTIPPVGRTSARAE